MGGIYMATPQEILRNPFLNKGTTINIIYMIKRKVIIPVIKWIQKV